MGYRKHRCYKYGKKCVCECLDFSDNFQSTRNKGAIANNGIDTVATLQAAGNYWSAPGYIIDHTEVIEIKKCCAKEYAVNPSFILPAHDCTSVGAATSAVIVTALKANIAKGMYDNNAIKKWLHDNGCGKHNKRQGQQGQPRPRLQRRHAQVHQGRLCRHRWLLQSEGHQEEVRPRQELSQMEF